jgi:hypothetical protein
MRRPLPVQLPAYIDFLRSHDIDLLAAQEVSASFHEELSKSNLFEWSVSSLTLRPLRSNEPSARRCGVSIFGRTPFRFTSPHVFSELRFWERALMLEAIFSGAHLTVCSFHIPPGASWGKEKTKAGDAIADWVSTQQGNLIFGIDANSPRIDHPDPKLSELWRLDSRKLLGTTPLHNLRDAYRVFLNDHPALFARIRAERPDGPLAISHYRHRGSPGTPCRYDFIYVSPHVTVENVEYICVRKELSDHALVVGQLSVGR